MKNLLPALLAVGLLMAAPVASNGQSYSIPWFSIDGGGGVSSGGPYTIEGTIGQADAGTMSGGNYTLTGGFWSIVAAVQSEGAPLLSVALTAPTTVVVSWPLPATGFTLERNSNLGTTNWANVVTPPTDNGGRRSVVLPAPPGQWFFRLKKP